MHHNLNLSPMLPEYTVSFEGWRKIVDENLEKETAAIAGIKEIIIAAGRLPDIKIGDPLYIAESYHQVYFGKNINEDGVPPSFQVKSFDGKRFDFNLRDIPVEQAKIIAEMFKLL